MLCLGLPLVVAQSVPQQQPAYEFFSGDVVELSADRLTVERKVKGKEQQRHSFLIKPDTKVEGKLAVKARVTVGFKPSEEGDVAIRVIVRPKPSPTAPTKGF
jgi:hypothetical protein